MACVVHMLPWQPCFHQIVSLLKKSLLFVFGMVDTSQVPALGVMEIVQRRDAATLLPTGSIIWSDEWAAIGESNNFLQ